MPTDPRHHVVVVGGGIAALELVLGLRATAGNRCRVTLISPDGTLRYRPTSVAEPFSGPAAQGYPWVGLARALGVEPLIASASAVLPDQREVIIDGHRHVPYDELVIAAGTGPSAGMPHASILRPETADDLHWVIAELEEQESTRLVLVAPPDCGWALPLYEFGLMAAERCRETSVETAWITLVTHERAPLECFRGVGSETVAGLLDEAGIELLTEREASGYDGTALELTPGGTIEADRVVALPSLTGPRIHGLPLDAHGFVRVDERFAVAGLDGVHAIGDAASFPVKQGGLATQAADTVASVIARHAGADVRPVPFEGQLRATLWTGRAPLYLSASLIGGDTVRSEAAWERPWSSPAKIVARHAGPFLAEVDEHGIAAAARRAPTVAPGATGATAGTPSGAAPSAADD